MKLKLLSVLLIGPLFFANYVHAFEVLPQKKIQNDNPLYFLADVVNLAKGDTSSFVSGLEQKATSFIDSTASKSLYELLKNDRGSTEISLTGITNKNPQVTGLILRPIHENDDGSGIVFIQSSLLYSDKRTTLNLGVGKRFFTNDRKLIFGLNAFYDHEFPKNHQRASLGGEIKTSVGDITVNRYASLSDWISLSDGTEERALGGHDIELAVPLPYMPTTFFRAKSFEWYAYGNTENSRGSTYSVSSKIDKNMAFEIGVTKNRGGKDQRFLQLAYYFDQSKAANKKPLFSKEPYQLNTIDDRIYEKVRRENRIVKQVRAVGFSVEFIGV